MTAPEPTTCEACKTYLRSEPSHIALNEWLKMFDEHHRIIAEKDARIRELVGLLAEYVDWHDDELGVDTPAEGNEPYWLERVRAVARSEKEKP